MLLLASDFDVNGIILRGLRRRVPNVELLRALDFLPEGTPDPVVLEWAAALNRILISNDRRTMVGYASARVAAAEPMPGLIVTTNDQAIGAAVDDLEMILKCMTPDEFRDQIIFLPL